MTSDRIEKQVEIHAPVSRVWRALTDHEQFSQWFCVKLDAPFQEGQRTGGQIAIAGYEHVRMEVVVQKITPESYFSYQWHPAAIDTERDYSREEMTLVEFFLDSYDGGTRLRVTESGFDAIPADRRDEAFRLNTGGWEGQLQNVKNYVDKQSI